MLRCFGVKESPLPTPKKNLSRVTVMEIQGGPPNQWLYNRPLIRRLISWGETRHSGGSDDTVRPFWVLQICFFFLGGVVNEQDAQMKWCFSSTWSFKQSLSATPPKFNIGTQNSSIWKEIHFPNHRIHHFTSQMLYGCWKNWCFRNESPREMINLTNQQLFLKWVGNTILGSNYI